MITLTQGGNLHPSAHAFMLTRCRSAALFHIATGLIALMLLESSRSNAQSPDNATLNIAKERFARIVAAELERKLTPGFSVAWIVDGKTVHEAGYGLADWEQGIPATAHTIYRAGSISKLFNAVAAMQLVEQGKIDLDAPTQRALPDFQIVVPFDDAIPVTVRQMLCHRSGMIREAPVGGYLDPTQPTVTASVASVDSCALVNPPNTKTRYSNVGPTIVGRAVEVLSGTPYVEYQQKNLLDPLGMKNSAWLLNDALRPRLAKAQMRVAVGDGTYRDEAAPQFELGTIPAGNLYSTAGDLARFASWVMTNVDKKADEATILKPESLAEMCRVQFTNESTGFGLGFRIDSHRGHKSIHHGGAVYGFSTLVIMLPEAKIAAVVLSNADICSAPVKRLAEASLDLLLETYRSEPTPAKTEILSLPAKELDEFAGEYESIGYWAQLSVKNGKLVGDFSGQKIELDAIEPLKFQANGRIMHRNPFEFHRDASGKVTGFTASGQKFERIDAGKSTRAPEAWKKLVGNYGPKFIPLVVSIRNGHLYATAENEYDYRLTPINRVTFRLPPGMYDDEHVVFQLDPKGNALGVVMANMYLPRQSR